MAVQRWDEDTLVVRLGNDPELSEDLAEIEATLRGVCCNIVLDLSDLDLLTSTGLASLLKTRKQMHAGGRRLILCSARDPVWGVFLTTGLDHFFEFAQDGLRGPGHAGGRQTLGRMRGGSPYHRAESGLAHQRGGYRDPPRNQAMLGVVHA